ncbi:MAG TPA: DEAD/DEAH box helicase [Acidimicrobiales bacterium]|nr:DEAD/DEAH box helicase [Acidimicrobiales bacterium]
MSPTATAPVGASTTPVTFAELGVPAAMAASLAARGITEPFPIQVATLPDALDGRDLCGRAPTGSGKTIAFGIPLVTRVGQARPGHPRGLVLLPTRELAGQVERELRALAGPKGPRTLAVYGGVGFGNQLSALRRGVDIVVATPGRLADLVNQRALHLDEVDLVVIDEADRMADMGFLPEVKRLLDRTRTPRQTLLFSATLDGDVDVLIKRYQRNPARHELEVDDDAPVNDHRFWRVERAERVAITAKVTAVHWPAVVFCRTKRGADRLARQLTKEGVATAAIHGDRSQGQRERALADFSSGRVQALVATDVAARGIHVDDVASVVHFDMPPDPKDYVHRSGRTGRAGAVGLVISLVPGDQVGDVTKMQRKLELPTGIHRADPEGLGTGREPHRRPPTPVATDDGARPGDGRNGGGRNRNGGANGGGRSGGRGGQGGGGNGGRGRQGQSGRGGASSAGRRGGNRRG